MNIIDRIRQMFLNKQEEMVDVDQDVEFTERCRHDWEVIKKHPDCGITRRGKLGPYGVITNLSWEFGDSTYLCPRQKVCLKCGECVDELQDAIAEIQARWDAEDARQELARKMWDNCKGE